MTAVQIFWRNITRAVNYLVSNRAVCKTGSSKTFCCSVGGNFTLTNMFGLQPTTKIFLNKHPNSGPHAVQQMWNSHKPNVVLPRVGEHVKIRFFKFLHLSVLHYVVLFFQAYHYCIKLLCFDLPSLHAITVHWVGGIVHHNPCPPLDHRVSCNVQQCNDATSVKYHQKLYRLMETLPEFIDNCWQILFYNRNHILSLWIQCLNTSKI